MALNKNYWTQKILFNSGAYFIVITSTLIITNLVFSLQWIYSLICSIICSLSAILGFRILGINNVNKKHFFLLIALSVLEFVLAFFYKSVSDQNIQVDVWIIGFLHLSSIAYLGAYRILVSAFFPQSRKVIDTPLPDPIVELPQNLQEIIMEGRKQVGNPTALTLLMFVMIGAIGYILSIFIFHGANFNIFFVPAGLGLFVSITLNIVLTYKWQRWARQSGIPEEELKKAAKSAGLWWPLGKKS